MRPQKKWLAPGIPAIAAVVALVVAGCGGASGGQRASAYGAPNQTTAKSSAPAAGATAGDSSAAATVRLANSKLGTMLVDSKGR
jgi:hypothetical protein